MMKEQIFLNSHILLEVENLCSHFAIITRKVFVRWGKVRGSSRKSLRIIFTILSQEMNMTNVKWVVRDTVYKEMKNKTILIVFVLNIIILRFKLWN